MPIATPSLFRRRFWPSALYLAVMVTAGCLSHFAILINDVFPLNWQAEHLSFARPESFYDGFFPIGFPLLLRIVSFTGNSILTLILVQIALAPLYAALVYRMIDKLEPGRSASILLPLALFAPPIIHAILGATPDFFAALAVLVGCLFIVRQNGKWNYPLAGLGVGIGCLFRSHILVLAVTLSLSILIFEKDHRLRAFIGFCCGVLPFVIAQGLLQVWSGHGFFENAQAFNIWKAMHGMDWSNPPALAHSSATSIIFGNPAFFFISTRKWILQNSLYFIPFVAGTIFLLVHRGAGNFARSKPLLLLTVASFVYLVITSVGKSTSAFTPVIPIAAACVVPMIDFVFSLRGMKFHDRYLTILTVLIWISCIIGFYLFIERQASRVEDYAEIEQLLELHSASGISQNAGERSTLDKRIYTDDYDLYFPVEHYHVPLTSGGWAEVGLPLYSKEFPHIRNASSEEERSDLLQHGIQWAIYRTPPYDPLGYQNVKSDTAHFRLTYRTRFHEIYRVQ
jgi:hypothetical protein